MYDIIIHPLDKRAATTRPYIPMIPAMTGATTFFMISSGRITPDAQIPTPDFAVPYAAPKLVKTTAAAHPITPIFAVIIFMRGSSDRTKEGTGSVSGNIYLRIYRTVFSAHYVVQPPRVRGDLLTLSVSLIGSDLCATNQIIY